MDTAHTFESRLISLAQRGFRAEISVSVPGYGKHIGKTSFTARLSKGDAYGNDGTGSMNVTGMGLSLEEAIGSALRAGEAFLGDPEPPHAITAAIDDQNLPLITAARDVENVAADGMEVSDAA